MKLGECEILVLSLSKRVIPEPVEGPGVQFENVGINDIRLALGFHILSLINNTDA
jgi:hypothetical protein